MGFLLFVSPADNVFCSDSKTVPANGTLDILSNERHIDGIMLTAPGTFDFDVSHLTSELMIDFAESKAKDTQREVGDAKIKKAGRFPVRVREGPAKNLFLKRQKNAQQDKKTQWSLLVYFDSGTKELIQTWRVFSHFC